MNSLQVKTTKLEPAIIVFNHKEVEKELDNMLEKYKNLVFSEDNATDLRKTIAEVRKGQNALNRYRIDTKKELNKTADEFDTTVKGLDEKFKNVLSPLLEQQAEFEETRKNEKRIKVQEIIDQVIEEFELKHEYADEIEIIDSHLTKSKTIKSITDELTSQAQHLKLQQDKEEMDKSVIETTVKLANSENELSLSVEAYIRLLEFQNVEKVKDQIENDAKKEVEARELAVKRELERIEREKKLQEEQEKLKEIAAVESEKIKQETPTAPVPKVSNDEINLLFPNPFDNEPVVEMTNPFSNSNKVKKVYSEVWEIEGTVDQFEELEEFLIANDISWSVKNE